MKLNSRSRKTAPRPTRKLFVLLGSSLLLFLIGANIQSGWIYVIAACFLGAAAAGMAVPGRQVRALAIERDVPPFGRAGEELGVRLTFRNSRRSSLGPIKGNDRLFSGAPFFIDGLPPRGETVLDYKISPPRRGAYESAAIEVSSSFPFGVATARRRAEVLSPVIIHPKWVRVAGFPFLEAASTPNEPIHDRRRKGAGLDFYGIREYRPGDSLRHVHWPSTARGQRVLVREFEEQPASRLGVLIDAGEALGSEPNTSFEDAVSSAASLVLYSLEVGHPVQLFCDSTSGTLHLFEPGRTEALDWLSRIEAGGRRGMARVAEDLMGAIQPRSTNVLIFPSTKGARQEALAAVAMLQELATRVVVVVLSAASYEEVGRDALSKQEEQEFLEELAASRTIVYRLASGGDLTECLKEPYLH